MARKPGFCASTLRFRIAFDQRATASDDGAGLKPGDWVEQFTRSSGIQYLRGGEEVISQRMAGVIPAVITVRNDPQTRLITSAWRARELKSGSVFNIRALPPPDAKPLTIDLLCDTGTVDG